MTTYYDQYLAPHLEMVRGIVRRHSYPASETADNFQSVVLVLLEHLEELGGLAQGALGGAAQFDPRPWISTVTLHALSTLNRRAQRHRATHLTPAGRPRADEEEGANEALTERTNAGCLPDPLVNDNAAAAEPFAPFAPKPAQGAPKRRARRERAIATHDTCLESWHTGLSRPGFHRTKAGRLWTAMRRRARQAGSAFDYARVPDARWSRALSALGTESRSVVLLHADGWSSAEIAEAMGLSAPSVRQLLSRGRARLARVRNRPGVFRQKSLAD